MSSPAEHILCDSTPEDLPLTVIVVSYNTRDMTLACLRSLHEQTRCNYEVIVVDNASSDGSAAAVAAEFPEIRLMAEAENHGFAQANNLAVRQARGAYVLLLNPDTVVLDGAVDKLLAFAKATPEARIWGGRTLYGDGSLNPTSCWGRMTLWNLFCRAVGLTALFKGSEFFNGEAYGDWPRDSVRAVDIVTGCLLMIRRDFWNDLEGFDPAFFMYAEEADLCLRARAQGADPHITPDATITHYVGASSVGKSAKMVRMLAGKIMLIDRHFPAWQRPLARALFRFWPLSRALAASGLALFSDRFAVSRDAWVEIWDRRSEWSGGYPIRSTSTPAPQATADGG